MDCAMDEAFAAAIEAIYDAAPNPALWPRALELTADVFGDVGAIMIWQRDDNSIGVIVSSRLEEAQKEYENGWWREDVRAQKGVDPAYLSAYDTVTDRDILRVEEIDTLPFYTQFLARHGLRWFASSGLSPDPHVRAFVSIQRAKEKPPFSDEELKVLSRLARNIEKSLRLSIQLFDAQSRHQSLSDALDRLGVGVFALDGDARVIFSNGSAKAATGDALAIVDGRLSPRSQSVRAKLDQALCTVIDPLSLGRADIPAIVIERAAPLSALALHVLPVTRAAAVAGDIFTRARALVLAIDLGRDIAPDPAVVRELFGFTLGEARVASLVGAGLSPRDAAAQLGIAESTARTVLKRVFSKAGVSRQAELVALFARQFWR
jgi:DNA-binding CsgD family transcriptional regulator